MGFVLRAAPSGIRRSHTASIAVRNLFVCRSVTFAVVRFWTSTALRRGLDSEHVTGPVRMNEKLSFTKNFERIADYMTSLARTVHYVTTGTLADKAILKASKEENT